MVSDYVQTLMNEMTEKYGPTPSEWTFGEDIDWTSPLVDATLTVELPFWLMLPDSEISVTWNSTPFEVLIRQLTMEVFVDFVSDSRQTIAGHTGLKQDLFENPDRLANFSAERGHPMMPRPCKTVLTIKTLAHEDIFRELTDADRPAVAREFSAYRASLCEAHIPVVNELIQRYRLQTYDYFPYEVSAWDVPIWYLAHSEQQNRSLLIGYKGWDFRPAIVGPGMDSDGTPHLAQFEWTNKAHIEEMASDKASQGEFDLLDARSLMERGDYTGAVRRAVTSIEALVAQRLLAELQKSMTLEDSEKELKKTERYFQRRLTQLQKLLNVSYPKGLLDSFEETRKMRHDIVHKGRRLTIHDRGRAQRAIDSGRWLFNRIEENPARTQLREHAHTLRSAGRVAMEVRFPAIVGPKGITIGPLEV